MRILRPFTCSPASYAFNSRHPIILEELLDKLVIIELDQELPKPLRVILFPVNSLDSNRERVLICHVEADFPGFPPVTGFSQKGGDQMQVG
jgi:hypothetical protein